MNRSSTIRFSLLAVLPVVVLGGCAAPRPPLPGGPTDDRTVEERVRAPSAGADDQLQVYAVRNPAVAALDRQARQAERDGDPGRAEQLLERALRIDPRDPEILQLMAEIQLAQGRLEQAGGFAAQAWEHGPRVGEICERSLRTLMVVHERAGEYDKAWRAFEGLPKCRVAPPERF
ncbi:MAG: tetratricopeptide repeat protein [Wenzhouxiangellaceae bacterium]